MTNGGPINPTSATAAPTGPRMRRPNTTERLTTFGPGRNWHSAYASLNSAGVIHLRSSTSIRRDHARTPPKPQSEIRAKATKSSTRVGVCGGEPGGDGEEGNGEEGLATVADMVEDLDPRQ